MLPNCVLMRKEEIEDYLLILTKQIEEIVKDYFSLPFFEQLDKVRNEVLSTQEKLDRKIGKKKKSVSQLVIVDLIDKLRHDLINDAAQLENTQIFQESIEKKVRILIASQIHSGMFEAYFRFMFIQALVGNGTHILNLEYRQKLKAEFDLIQQSNFMNALFDILNPVFILPGKDEDITHFWNDNKCLELLANYNRLSLIIKYVRRELNKNRNQEKELQNAFGFSEEWFKLVDSSDNIKDLALKWAADLMELQNAMDEFYSLRKTTAKNKKEVENLSFEHLHNRILRKARKISPTKGMLVYCTFYGGGRQLGSVDPNTEMVKLLKVENWSMTDAIWDSVFFEAMSF